MKWYSLLMVALLVGLTPDLAHASVLLTPANPSTFADYPAPIFVGVEPAQANDGFIVIEFADSLFGADDQLRVRGFSTTDGQRIPDAVQAPATAMSSSYSLAVAPDGIASNARSH